MSTEMMEIEQSGVEAFHERVLGDLAASYGGVMVSIGGRLGLYEAMKGAGPLSPGELAGRTACTERYVREWLNSQAAAGYVLYERLTARYELPDEHALVLADRSSPAFMTPAFNVVASMWLDEDLVVDAFRSGEGVSWGSRHERLFCGVAAFYRNGYAAALVPDWLPSLDGVTGKLEAGGKVADVGCGYGHSTVLMAQAFPNSRFWGYDPHEGSILEARENARAAGVADRVTFEVGTATSYSEVDFDLICFFDCLHDLGDPVAAARHARLALEPEGSVMLVEPSASDEVAENTGTVARLYYSGSTALCCAHALSEEGGYSLGAQAGEARLAGVFKDAGFGDWSKVVETPFNMIAQVRAN